MNRTLLWFLLLLGCCAVVESEDSQNPPAPPPASTTTEGFNLHFGTEDHFEVVTWNIETFPKHERTVEFAARCILGLRPDILAIQEVWSEEALHQLADRLPGYGLSIPPDLATTGLAYLYRRETVSLLEAPSRIFIEDNYDFSYRPPFVLKIRFGDLDLTLVNLHLKCCGDGLIGTDYWDEELRREKSVLALKEHIEENWSEEAVIVLGDWNDSLTDPVPHNVFRAFTEDPTHYQFADRDIAEGPSSNWSFPYYPSHLDHILITNELFDAFESSESQAQTLRLESLFPGGLDEYWSYLSDHRPTGMRLKFP